MEKAQNNKPVILKIWVDGALKGWSKRKVIGMAAVTCYRGGSTTKTPEIRSWRVEAKRTRSMHAELFAIQCALEAV
ncbi:MAG TPA: hypothetical protein VEP90_05525, partial [Methylomirabilota bacterium]|nr:hypothetical protein [Methylomirabilota bacterium]